MAGEGRSCQAGIIGRLASLGCCHCIKVCQQRHCRVQVRAQPNVAALSLLAYFSHWSSQLFKFVSFMAGPSGYVGRRTTRGVPRRRGCAQRQGRSHFFGPHSRRRLQWCVQGRGKRCMFISLLLRLARLPCAHLCNANLPSKLRPAPHGPQPRWWCRLAWSCAWIPPARWSAGGLWRQLDGTEARTEGA